MFGHLADVLPVLLLREAHDVEDAVQLVVVVRVARLDVLLAAVEDRLRRQQLGEDAPDRPYVCRTKHKENAKFPLVKSVTDELDLLETLGCAGLPSLTNMNQVSLRVFLY